MSTPGNNDTRLDDLADKASYLIERQNISQTEAEVLSRHIRSLLGQALRLGMAVQAEDKASPEGGVMKIYVLNTFGRLPDAEVDLDDDAPEADRYGFIVLGRYTTEEAARARGEAEFLARDKSAGTDTWIKEARVWSPDRDPAFPNRICLWSMLPRAAGAKSEEWYPQARTTSYWYEVVEVETGNAR